MCVCTCMYMYTKYIYIYIHTHIHTYIYHSFSGACTKLRKAINRFVMSACPSVRPRGTTRIPQDGFFLLNFMFENFRWYFEKIFHWNLIRIKGNVHAHICTFVHLWCLAELILGWDVSDKICRENRNKHFIINNFSENPAVYEIVWKNRWPSGAPDGHL